MIVDSLQLHHLFYYLSSYEVYWRRRKSPNVDRL